jgi:hypothetical protein
MSGATADTSSRRPIAPAATRCFTLEYKLQEPIVALEDDPTPFAEPEDFDFGLVVANVANDEGRRSRIYSG